MDHKHTLKKDLKGLSLRELKLHIEEFIDKFGEAAIIERVSQQEDPILLRQQVCYDIRVPAEALVGQVSS